ncbi:MAG: lactate racemase domain-containing protein [Isosphaeraceae bacterium]|nr:lactate racemase domain-containing protein [Isosphaeraceae bacterium]
MRRVSVSYGGRTAELELPEDRLIGVRSMPAGLDAGAIRGMTRTALESPVDYPALRSSVVPGDRVTIGSDLRRPLDRLVLDEVVATLREAEVGSIVVVGPESAGVDLPEGVGFAQHRPTNREELAYLASTQAGDRVYLNRELAEADFVILMSEVGHDGRGRETGPWSLLSPGLADPEALVRRRTSAASSDDCDEIAWLLGYPFQIGLIPGGAGPLEVHAGAAGRLRESTRERIGEIGRFTLPEEADLVIASLGDASVPADWSQFAAALDAAARLVRRGGRVVLLSDLAVAPGAALGRIASARDLHRSGGLLRGRESEPDWPAAEAIARLSSHADLFLLADLDHGLIDDIGLFPLESPAQAARLAREAHSCVVIERAELLEVDLLADSSNDPDDPTARRTLGSAERLR